jgi:hypothetical protein
MRGMISGVRLESIVDPTVRMQLELCCCVLLASRSVIHRTLVAANGKGRNLPILYYDFDGTDCLSRIATSNSLTAATAAAAAAARAGVFRWVFITVVAV